MFLYLSLHFNTIKYTVNSDSFAVGLRFYYWEYYKSLQQLDDDEQYISYAEDDPIDNSNAEIIMILLISGMIIRSK